MSERSEVRGQFELKLSNDARGALAFALESLIDGVRVDLTSDDMNILRQIDAELREWKA
jgi:hypothetical protein